MLVEGLLTLEFDTHQLSELFYTVKTEFKNSEERFSSMVFNLKHFFTQDESFEDCFDLELRDLHLVEPYRFELAINAQSDSAYLTFLIENALKTLNVAFEVVDSDLLTEALPNTQDPRGPSAVLSLVSQFIFNKNKIVSLVPGERVTLVAKLAMTGTFSDADEKVLRVFDKCSVCNRRPQSGNPLPVKGKSKDQVNRYSFVQKLRIVSESSASAHQSLVSISHTLKPAKPASSLQTTAENNITVLNSQSQLSNPLLRQFTDLDKQDKKSNQIDLRSLSKESDEPHDSRHARSVMPFDELDRCTCGRSYQNYVATQLRVTYLTYIRFPDGANSMLKAETMWSLRDESPVKLSVHTKSTKALVDESLIINLIIENLTITELELVISEDAFQFSNAPEDKQFGSLILENKQPKSVFIPAMNKDTIPFSFTPIKSGLVELERVSLTDGKSKRIFAFECKYKILIS